MSRPGTYRVSDEEIVSIDVAQGVWVEEAHAQLLETARVYHSVITYRELAEHIQERTGIRTSMVTRNWVGSVLTVLAGQCQGRGEPILSSLCVNAEGSVGEGYGEAIRSAQGAVPADPDDHAARERLACYRHFGAQMPADGGRPALAPKMQARRDRATAQRPERRGAVCPNCFTEVPVTGVCGRCG